MTQQLLQSWVLERLPARAPESHKGTYGRLLLLAGSPAYRGAAALAAEGALRGGAGYVTLASCEAVFAVVLPRLPECICCAAEDPAALEKAAQAATALAAGPGIGTGDSAAARLELALTAGSGPALLDADALTLLAERPALWRAAERRRPVLTPHPGEMARLCGVPVSQVQENRAQLATGFARAHGCVVVLKGHRTLVAGPEGDLLENTTGNAGLARGGSGDVLAGLLGALLAQGLDPLAAAGCAVWMHGRAADLCAARRGQLTLLPHDIFEDLGTLLARMQR